MQQPSVISGWARMVRWLALVLLAFSFATGCDLNPQPEVPGANDPEPSGGAAGAAGAGGDLGTPSVGEDDPGREAASDPADYSGGLQSGKAARPDSGPERQAPDAGAEASSPPPVVAM